MPEPTHMYGYIDETGKVIIPYTYTYADDFHQGLAFVKDNRKGGYIDIDGNTIIPFTFNSGKGFYRRACTGGGKKREI
jgi:hypothetical protein